jgi:hypothetical protein
MVVESVSFVKLFSYFPLKFAPNFQRFLYAFGRDKPVNMFGDKVYSLFHRIKGGLSKTAQQEEESSKFFNARNTIFSQPLIYLKLVGLKLIFRYLINILLGFVLLMLRNKSHAFIKQRKITYKFIKLIVNLGLVINFEIFQNDGKLAVFSLTKHSKVNEILIVGLDCAVFCLSHLYLWRLFKSKQVSRAEVSTK